MGALALVVALRRVQARAQKLAAAVESAEQRSFLGRVPEDKSDGVGQAGAAVNRLLQQLTDLSARALDKDLELRWAQEKLALQNRLEARLREKEMLADLAQTFTQSLDINEVLQMVCDRVATTLGIDEVAILLFEPHSNALVCAAACGIPVDKEVVGLKFPLGVGITGELWEKDSGLIYITDTATDDRFLHWGGAHEVSVGAMVGIRLEFGTERLGMLDCTRLVQGGFSEEDINLLSIVAHQAAIAVRNARLYQETLELATHDALTSLLNRRTFVELLETEWARRARFGDVLSVAILDIDNFKSYNDRYGHLLGDQVLAEVAAVLARNVRKVDVVARYGGEEFVVLLTRTGLDAALSVGEKLRRAVAAMSPADIHPDLENTPTISVGVAEARPSREKGADPLDVLDRADQALLRAKESGRNQVVRDERALLEPDA